MSSVKSLSTVPGNGWHSEGNRSELSPHNQRLNGTALPRRPLGLAAGMRLRLLGRDEHPVFFLARFLPSPVV
jgi:hypothetical protein